MMMLLHVLAWLFSAAALDIQWSADQLVHSQNVDIYPERRNTLEARSIGNYLPAIFASRSADSSVTDGIYGAAYAAGNSYTPPFAELAYFELYSKWSQSAWLHTSDYGYAQSYIATTDIQLDEVDESGVVHQTISWKDLPWTYTTHHLENLTYIQWKSGFYGPYCYNYPNCGGNNNNNNQQGGNNNKNNNNAWTPSGQNKEFKTFGNLNVSWVLIAANRSGLLTSGAVVTPNSLVNLLEIYGFPYQNTSNSLRFTMGILSASNTTDMETHEIHHRVRQTVGHGSHANFIDLPTSALVDEVYVTVPVTFNEGPTDNELGNWKLTSIIRPYLVKGGLVIKSRTAQVTFPPGAQNVTWQPVFGAGLGPVVPMDQVEEREAQEAAARESQSHNVVIISSSVAGAAVVLAIIVAAYCILSRRKQQKIAADINADNTTSQEQDKLVITQNPSSYQTLA